MKELLIEKTFNSPYVFFNPETGILRMEGRAIPEDPGEIFNEIFTWLEEYFLKPAKVTKLDFQLEYINSGSSKFLLELFRRVKKKQNLGNEVLVNWYYEEDDESVKELGEHYKNSVNIPFNLIEYF